MRIRRSSGRSIFIALAVSAVSTTIALSSLFNPIRKRAKVRLGWFGKLISCAYCNSHWLAFLAVAWFHPRVVDGWWLANYLLVAFAVIALANVVTGVIRKTNYFWAIREHREGRSSGGGGRQAGGPAVGRRRPVSP